MGYTFVKYFCESYLLSYALAPKNSSYHVDTVTLGMDVWFPDNNVRNKICSLVLVLAADYVKKWVYDIVNSLIKVN